jgi:hypothetical protein
MPIPALLCPKRRPNHRAFHGMRTADMAELRERGDDSRSSLTAVGLGCELAYFYVQDVGEGAKEIRPCETLTVAS